MKKFCDAIRFMRHKVGAHKIRQITIITYKLFTNYSYQIVKI